MRVVAPVFLVLLLMFLAPAALAQSGAPGYETCESENDCDGDGFPDDVEEALGSDPEDPDDTPSFDITFSAEIVIGEDGSITIIWQAAGAQVQGYIIWSSNSPWVKLASLSSNTLSYKIDEPVPGTKYKVTYFIGATEPEGFINGEPNGLGGWSEGTYLQAPGGAVDNTGSGDGTGAGDGSGTSETAAPVEEGLPTWFYATMGVLLLAAIGLAVALVVQGAAKGAAA